LRTIRQDVAAARGGDQDAAEKARRSIIDCDGLLGDLESANAWPELNERVFRQYSLTASWVADFGTDVEKTALSQCMDQVQRSLRAKNARDIERHLKTLKRLSHTAILRHPDYWSWELDACAGLVAECSDPARAQSLVSKARKAEQKGDRAELQRQVRDLWRLLPGDTEERALSFNSGVR
jgi:molecular chaperone DnaK